MSRTVKDSRYVDDLDKAKRRARNWEKEKRVIHQHVQADVWATNRTLARMTRGRA